MMYLKEHTKLSLIGIIAVSICSILLSSPAEGDAKTIRGINLTAYDNVSKELFFARGNNIFLYNESVLITTKSKIVILEVIRTVEPNFQYLFYCLQTEKPSCHILNMTSGDEHIITVHANSTFSNFLSDPGIISLLIETDAPSMWLLSLARSVKKDTLHLYRHAACVFSIDIYAFEISVQHVYVVGAESPIPCILPLESPFDWTMLNAFVYKTKFNMNMYIYLIAEQGGWYKTSNSGLVLIQMSLYSCKVVESALECIDTPTRRNSSVATNFIDRADGDADGFEDTIILLSTGHSGGGAICSLPFKLIDDHFFYSRKRHLNSRNVSPAEDNTYAEEHAATTLFMSKVTSFFHTNAEAVSLSVTRHEDYFLAHVLTKDSEITTVKLGDNSQVVSVTKITNQGKENSNGISQSLVSYDNTLYVCDDQTIHMVDVSQCERHPAQDTCLRDVVDCSWCNNTVADVSGDVTAAPGVNSSHCSTASECMSPVNVYMGAQPHVSEVYPTWGPKSGGNIIEVIGDQIDMAQNVTVTIAGNTCRILQASVVRSSLHCVVPGYDGHVTAPSEVHVQLDGVSHVLEYQYVEDPVITSVFPKRTITSGGIRINITWDNVATRYWSNMYLVFADPDATYTTRHFPCDVTRMGVSCITPPVRDSFENTKQRMRLSLGVSGSSSHVDGFLHTQPIELQVLPDPIVQNFMAKILTPSQEVVIFEGTNLNDVEMSEISVEDLYQKKIFIVTNVTSTDIHCRLKVPTSSRLFLKVMIGEHLVFYPGVAVQKSRITTPEVVPSSSTHPNSSPSHSSGSGSSQSDVVPEENPEEPGTSKDFTVAIVVPVICACVVVALVVGLAVKARRRKRRLNRQRPSIVSYSGSMGVVIGERSVTRNLSNASISDVRLTDDTDDIAKEIIRRLEEEELIIKRTHLKMQKLIGRGNFGSVFKGIFQEGKDTREVAVKTLHQDEPRDLDIQLFLKEAYVMRDFRHSNVMTLVGICLDLDEMPLVIIPYMEHGDLLTYLHEDKHIPTVKDLVSYGLDIARGMTYLAQLKFVHRDLAARNCMLDSNYTVKVADFGLSRDIYESSYYSARSKGTKLPVKWMAIDSLTNGVFNEKTDVWSYGVTLWELMTRGVRPYATVDNWDMERYLQSGRRLPQPMYCPNQLYRVMRKCWMESPDERPAFDELQEWISEMLARVHHQLGNADRATNIQTTYVNLSMGASYHYENTADFHDD